MIRAHARKEDLHISPLKERAPEGAPSVLIKRARCSRLQAQQVLALEQGRELELELELLQQVLEQMQLPEPEWLQGSNE